jgi:general secretion pathway protein K
MRTTVGSRQSAVGSEALISGRVSFLPVRHSLNNNSSSIDDASLPTDHCPPRTDDGVILIALLWILTAMAVIALSFSKESFVEVSAARNAQSLESAYFAARAGIATTIYQLIQKRQTATQANSQTTQTTTVDPLDLGIVTGTYGNAAYQVVFQDESAKINVNSITAQKLHDLCEAVGISTNDADVITDSIMDWRDSDSNARTNGAENDHYQSLTPAYNAKNANIDTIEELLLIRGITTDYFYGHSERADDGSIVYMYGLSRYLTAQPALGNNSQINVNFAEVPVLRALGIDAQTAQAIYDQRKLQPFKNMSELTSSSTFSIGTAASSLTTASSNLYTFTVSAQAANSKALRIIRAVIYLPANSTSSQAKKYQTLYWNENVPDYEGNTP